MNEVTMFQVFTYQGERATLHFTSIIEDEAIAHARIVYKDEVAAMKQLGKSKAYAQIPTIIATERKSVTHPANTGITQSPKPPSVKKQKQQKKVAA